MIKSVPNVNNEANNIPDIVDDSGDDPKTDKPAKTWSRGDRLRAKTVTIHEADDLILKTSSLVEHSQQHEADDLILKTSSPVEQSQQGKNFLNQASRSNMNALSVFSSRVTAISTLRRPGRESSALLADSEEGIVTKPSQGSGFLPGFSRIFVAC